MILVLTAFFKYGGNMLVIDSSMTLRIGALDEHKSWDIICFQEDVCL